MAGLRAFLRAHRGWIVLAIAGIACVWALHAYTTRPLRPPADLLARALDPAVAAAFPPGSVWKDCDECPEIVVIPAGRFEMGSTTGDLDEQPVRSLVVRSFALGRFEVTQAQLRALMGDTPSDFPTCGAHCPADISQEMFNYLSRLSQRTGQAYRLPSAAEWEYAARAGSTSRWSHGDDPERLGDYAWYGPNAGGSIHPVGQKRPNRFGLYDMAGNVWERVDQCSGIGSPTDDLNPVRDKGYPGSCLPAEELRGGSWLDGPRQLRPANRHAWHHPGMNESIGFRVARDLPASAPAGR